MLLSAQVVTLKERSLQLLDSLGAGERGRTSDLLITNPAPGRVESITSSSWVCRTRQNVTFRAPKTQPIQGLFPATPPGPPLTEAHNGG